MSVTLDDAIALDAAGLNLIPVAHALKQPDTKALRDGRWERYQKERTTRAELAEWFGDGERRNAGIVLGHVSGVIVVETDSPEAEAWASEHLPPTPMMTKSARGMHRYYLRPTTDDVPAFINAGEIVIEVKRDGQYVLAPGSLHPTGVRYERIGAWPGSVDELVDILPLLPLAVFAHGAERRPTAPPLTAVVDNGSRNNALFVEACRFRRQGYGEDEIVEMLRTPNRRCTPPLPEQELRTIARSASRYDPGDEGADYPTTEAGDAEAFAAAFGDRVRFDHRRKRWLLAVDSGHWLPDQTEALNRHSINLMRRRQQHAATIDDMEKRKAHFAWAIKGESRTRLTNMQAIARSLAPVADAGDGWDPDPFLLGVPNGVVDLRTGLLRIVRPEDRITMRTRATFDPAAACPLWDATVRSIFGGDDTLIAYFDRLVGYSITGDCREECLPLCWGSGANGKGTIMNTLGWLLGDYADDLPFSALEMDDRAGIPNDIAKLVGRRFVTSSETGETRRLNEARIKALTGRDPITARFLHKEFFTFEPVAKFWLATNNKPMVRDTSVGFWRRIHMLPFTQSFADKPDLKLKDKLREEAPGILARAVRGCLAWQRDGLNPPSIVRDATAAYRDESMPLTRFLDARCVTGEGKRASFTPLYRAYQEWSAHEKGGKLNRRQFSDALRERFKTDPSARRSTAYLGVGLYELYGHEETDL